MKQWKTEDEAMENREPATQLAGFLFPVPYSRFSIFFSLPFKIFGVSAQFGVSHQDQLSAFGLRPLAACEAAKKAT